MYTNDLEKEVGLVARVWVCVLGFNINREGGWGGFRIVLENSKDWNYKIKIMIQFHENV